MSSCLCVLQLIDLSGASELKLLMGCLFPNSKGLIPDAGCLTQPPFPPRSYKFCEVIIGAVWTQLSL